MSDLESLPAAGLQDLKDAIHRVGDAVGQMAAPPDMHSRIFDAILHILQDHERRIQTFEHAFHQPAAPTQSANPLLSDSKET